MSQKEVKIIGLNVINDFGGLKATQLFLKPENRITTIKGEVGSGKTTLNKAMRLTAQGSDTLKDKSLYGNDVNLETQLLDGDLNVYVGCKSNADGALIYTLYTKDSDGKKVKDVVIDGIKATPAKYLSSIQTELTWRLDELTSESATIQRNLLLELYRIDLEAKGVVFDKKSPKYVGGIIDKIEKAKNDRNYCDMKRKEVGGIAEDLKSKGISTDERMVEIENEEINQKILKLKSLITLSTQNLEQTRKNNLNQIKLDGQEALKKLESKQKEILEHNKKVSNRTLNLNEIDGCLGNLEVESNRRKLINETINKNLPKLEPKKKELEFSETGSCISLPKDFEDSEVKELLKNYRSTAKKYSELNSKPLEEVDNSENETKLKNLQERLKDIDEHNNICKAVNAFWDWKESDEIVKSLSKDYFLKLTEIDTGVEGLYISPEFKIDGEEKIATGNDIYLYYDGSYDPKYFSNENKDLRKLSSYSDTQKPMICLLIQKYLLSRKAKILPYLWIDNVPIDLKTKALLDRMSEELGLWLFVNWTGDFAKESLAAGELLIEGGEIFFNE